MKAPQSLQMSPQKEMSFSLAIVFTSFLCRWGQTFKSFILIENFFKGKNFYLDDSISEYVIFMMGAGCCPEAPVAGGTRLVLRRGEPPGQVPRSAGAKGSFLHPIESHKKRCFLILIFYLGSNNKTFKSLTPSYAANPTTVSEQLRAARAGGAGFILIHRTFMNEILH